MSNGISDINEYKKILSSIKNEYVIGIVQMSGQFGKNFALSLRN